jgi:signal transduction histidine kinase
MKDFSLRFDLPEDMEYSQTSLAIATEWLVSLLRWGVLLLFAFLRPYLAPGVTSAEEPFYAFLLVGVLYNLYASYLLASGAVRQMLPHFLTFFVFSDTLILVALAYFSNIYQTGLLVFYLLLIVIIALRSSLRLSLLLGPIMVITYFFSTYYLIDPELFNPGRMVLDSLGLLALTTFCGWFAEGKSRAWRALYHLSQRFKAVNKSLGETQRRLEIYRRLDAMRREFLAMMSHELRTPLTAVVGYLDLLLLNKAGPVTERQRYFIESAVHESMSLEKLIGNLLDLSLIQSGRWHLSLERIQPSDLLESARDSVLRQAEEKGVDIQIVTDREATLPEIIADRKKIETVLVNLLNNAVNFSPTGILVMMSVAEGDDERLRERLPHLISSTRVVTFTVRDNGPGISLQEREFIFESFHRIAENIEKKLPRGGGLGLAIAREFIELHWGRIGYKDSPGGGSTFEFSLPVNPLRPRHRIALVKSVFNLESLLEGLLLQFGEELRRKRIHVVRKGWTGPESEGTFINADRQLMQTLFFNLINNQIRYASTGSELLFSIDGGRDGKDLLITCRNSGENMDWDVMEQLRTGETGPVDAVKRDLRQVGVGLSLARDIIETHDGSFFVENLEYGGVELTIRFPSTAGRRKADGDEPKKNPHR